MVIFHSYVSLPKAKKHSAHHVVLHDLETFHGGLKVFLFNGNPGRFDHFPVGYGDDPGSFHLVKRCQKSRIDRQNSLGLGAYRVCTVVTNAIGNFTPILSGLLHPFHLSVSFPLVNKQYSQQGGRPPVMFVALQNP